MADARPPVVTLDGSNYPTWKVQCRMLLIRHGLWRIVKGEEVAPIDNPAALNKFNERCDKALSTIVLAVSPSLLYLLGDPEDPVEVWKILENQFQAKTWANKLNLKCKLHNLKLEENQSVQDHLKTMTEIFDELNVIGYPVEEEDRVVQMLASLPESYGMIKTAFEASPEVPKLAVLTERLINEERKIKEKRKPGRENSHDALFVGASNQKRCFYCGKSGHIKRFCEEWLKKCENENKENNLPVVANMCFRSKSHVDSESSDDECIALVSEVSEEIKKKWTLDSAASRHMCNDRRQFQKMKRLDEEVNVKIGDGNTVRANFEGTVKLRIKAINQVRKFKLKNVLFVPDLKYNLLSVSQASESGKSIQFDQNGAQIKDTLTKETVGTATRKGMLYHVNIIGTGEKNRLRPKREKSSMKDMEKAFLCMRENNFKEEIMKRLDRIEEDKSTSSRRINTVEEDMNSTSYTLIKDESFQNEQIRPVCMHELDDVMCIQEYPFREQYNNYEEDQISIQEDSYETENPEVGNEAYFNSEESAAWQIYTSQEDIESRCEVETEKSLEAIESSPTVIKVGETNEQSLYSSPAIDVEDLSIHGNQSTRKMSKNKLPSAIVIVDTLFKMFSKMNYGYEADV